MADLSFDLMVLRPEATANLVAQLAKIRKDRKKRLQEQGKAIRVALKPQMRQLAETIKQHKDVFGKIKNIDDTCWKNMLATDRAERLRLELVKQRKLLFANGRRMERMLAKVLPPPPVPVVPEVPEIPVVPVVRGTRGTRGIRGTRGARGTRDIRDTRVTPATAEETLEATMDPPTDQ